MSNEEREALIAQGWTPPVAVDPDWAEAVKLANEYAECDDWPFLANWFLKAIKRGRELGRAEAKPGLVWVKHDRSEKAPIDRDAWVLTRNYDPETTYARVFECNRAHKRLWQYVTHYAIITPPEDK